MGLDEETPEFWFGTPSRIRGRRGKEGRDIRDRGAGGVGQGRSSRTTGVGRGPAVEDSRRTDPGESTGDGGHSERVVTSRLPSGRYLTDKPPPTFTSNPRRHRLSWVSSRTPSFHPNKKCRYHPTLTSVSLFSGSAPTVSNPRVGRSVTTTRVG